MDAVKPVAEEIVEGMEAEEEEGDTETIQKHGKPRPKWVWRTYLRQHLKCHLDGQAEMRRALAEVDTKNAATYTKNAAAYTAQIQAVDDEIAGIVAASTNKLLVFGDLPFRYFVDEFGLEYQAAFPGYGKCTEDGSAGTLAYLMNTIKEQNIKYVYYIELSNQNIARAISEQTGAQQLQLHSAHNVTRTILMPV